MNKYKYYLFDLDGTISESALGIRESLENAIKSMGKPLPNLDDYSCVSASCNFTLFIFGKNFKIKHSAVNAFENGCCRNLSTERSRTCVLN